MKKHLLFVICPLILTACSGGDYRRSSAEINAARNSAQSIVTEASLAQARRQRDNELEEAILQRRQATLENQSRAESSRVVTDSIGSFFQNTIGILVK